MNYKDTFKFRYEHAETLGDLIDILEDAREFFTENGEKEDLEECLDILSVWYSIIERNSRIDIRNLLVENFENNSE